MNREEIAEKQKVISRNHWMFRLYRFTWGKECKYVGYCPLFHSTIFNLAVLPLTCLSRMGESLVSWVIDILPEKPEKSKRKSKFTPTDGEIVAQYEEGGYYCINYSRRDEFNEWIKQNPNWAELYPAAKEREEDRRIKQEKIDEANEIRRAKLAAKREKIVVWAKYLVKPGLAVSALGAAWLTYWVVGWMVSIFSFSVFIDVIKVLGLVGLISVGVYGTWKILKAGARLIKFDREVIQETPSEPGILSKIWYVFSEAFEFLANTIDILYKKNCPLIRISENETRPIEKINK